MNARFLRLFAVVCLHFGQRAESATFSVIMTNFTYLPKTININQGDTITWVNRDAAGHDAVSGANKVPSGVWESPMLANGASWSFTFTNVAPGNYPYYCTPHVFAPNYMTGLVVVAQSAVNLTPSVGIASPTNNTVFIAPATFTIQAAASDSDGSVAQVEFFNGTASLGVDPTSPYTAAVNNLSAGTYSLSAVATDNLGAKATNSVTVTIDAPPTVSLTSPTNNATFASGANITLQASAGDTDGNVTKVQFFADSYLIGTAATAPYAFTWTAVPTGSYTLSAKATDNLGATVESSLVNISVVYSPPSAVTLLNSAINGTSFSFSFVTQTGASYAVEFSDSPSSFNSQPLTNYIGDGTTVTVTDALPTSPRFYRVTAQ
jgi:plastocyanin